MSASTLAAPAGSIFYEQIMSADALYTDGGVIGHNNRLTCAGVTWAYCFVRSSDDTRTYTDAGTLVKGDWLPEPSNNIAELLAVVHALEVAPDEWRGTVYTDSEITLGRMSKRWALRQVPDWLVARMGAVLRRHPKLTYALVAGHPSAADLAAGYRLPRPRRGDASKDGMLVSKHNVWCDDQCRAQAELYAHLKVSTAS